MSDHANVIGDPRVTETGVEADDINSVKIAVWGLVSVFVTLAVVLLAIALFNEAADAFEEERVVGAQYIEADRVIDTQRGLLNKYAPPEADGKPYRMPIDRAKTIVVQEMQSQLSVE
ncbi:hypothetical protein Mal64_23490 [Pseudobythopirellula maris]|uniref:Uncharacterized protein n=1 Tax=Pseudobythopirellula maris TaxID=2527991 RepID=A0A5C5ZPY2_9BACT|nr:hypothetical protein [Pseudobythopirellula maris]TWT88861.1 hypothetical protein Mal64_23490 [Pseudobythopirellula maris]